MSKRVFLPATMIFVSIITSFLVGMDSSVPEYYSGVFLLPLCEAVLCFLFINTISNCFENLVSIAVVMLYFLRNTISILFMYLGNYNALITPSSSADVYKAIVLMFVETLVIFCVIRNRTRKEKKYEKVKTELTGGIGLIPSMFFIVIAVAVVMLWNVVPALRVYYVSFFDEGAASYTHLNNTSLIAGTSQLLVMLFMLLFTIVRLAIPAVVISWASRKFKSSTLTIVIAAIILLLQLFFASSETIDVILVDVSVFLVLIRIYPEKTKGLIAALVLIGGAGLFYILQQKSGADSLVWSDWSGIFQAYLPGVSNTTGVFKISNFNRWECFLNDMRTSLPMLNPIGDRTNDLFLRYNNVRGQIIPFIGEMYIYIGVLAPLGMALIMKCAYFFYDRTQKAVNIVTYTAYVYATVLFTISMVLYHSTIIGQKFFGGVLPIIIICEIITWRNNRNDLYRSTR